MQPFSVRYGAWSLLRLLMYSAAEIAPASSASKVDEKAAVVTADHGKVCVLSQ